MKTTDSDADVIAQMAARLKNLERVAEWARGIRDLSKMGLGDVITLRTDGASFARLFYLVDAVDEPDSRPPTP